MWPAPIRLNESVTAMLRCWYRANDMFIPRGKELISTIAFLDEDFGNLEIVACPFRSRKSRANCSLAGAEAIDP